MDYQLKEVPNGYIVADSDGKDVTDEILKEMFAMTRGDESDKPLNKDSAKLLLRLARRETFPDDLLRDVVNSDVTVFLVPRKMLEEANITPVHFTRACRANDTHVAMIGKRNMQMAIALLCLPKPDEDIKHVKARIPGLPMMDWPVWGVRDQIDMEFLSATVRAVAEKRTEEKDPMIERLKALDINKAKPQ